MTKSPQLFVEREPPQPHPSELRDWSHLPDLPLRQVLQLLVPCLSSLSYFAGTCRPSCSSTSQAIGAGEPTSFCALGRH